MPKILITESIIIFVYLTATPILNIVKTDSLLFGNDTCCFFRLAQHS